MRRLLHKVPRFLRWAGLGIILAQITAMLGLTVLDALGKKRRKLRRFPYTPATPVAFGEDDITIYTYGEELYKDMLAAIEGAQESVYFETYIWKSDEVGEAFRKALGDAAARGVDVYVIWDQFANLVVPRRFFRSIPESVNAMPHHMFPLPWSPRTWGLDHRKLLVVDKTTGFVGGYNIGSLYATGWRDTHVRVEGPGAAELENAFVDYWNLHASSRKHPRLANPGKRQWFSGLRLHRNTPRLAVFPIRNMYLEAFDRASERIWLTHAYLIPDADVVAALRDAVARGVDVRIIVPAQSNHVVADWLSRGFYADLLHAGVRIFLYQNAMVHSKTAVIDGVWSTIGTANLDRLSLAGNYEVNLEVTDRDVGRLMESIFDKDLSNTVEMTEQRWAKRSVVAKFTEYLLSPWRPFF